jgi:hypothetical protein
LTVNYIGDDAFRGRDYRRARLLDTKGFVCRCERCEGVYDEMAGVPCVRCKVGTAMPNNRTGTLDCGNPACKAVLVRSDWPAGHWAKADELLQMIVAIDDKVTETRVMPQMDLEDLLSVASSTLGKYHWGTMVVLFMIADMCSTALLCGTHNEGAAEAGLRRACEWLLRFKDHDPRMDLGAVPLISGMKASRYRRFVPELFGVSDKCPVCSKPAPLVCARCRFTRYCSTACQKRDWKSHKPTCLRVV